MVKSMLLAVAVLVTVGSVAHAACPVGTRYMCYPTINGKQMCGCY